MSGPQLAPPPDMSDQQGYPHRKAVFSLLLALLALPAVVALVSAASGVRAPELGGAFFRFLGVAASRTRFPDLAETYYLAALVVMPIQFALIAWYLSGLDLDRFQRSLASYSANAGVISIRGIVVLRKRAQLWLLCTVLFAVVFFGMFFVGTGYKTKAGSPTASVPGFLMMNTAGVVALQLFVMQMCLWSRFELNRKGKGAA